LGSTVRNPVDAFLSRLSGLERRLGRLERMPSGAKAIGVRQIGTLPAARVYCDTTFAGLSNGLYEPLEFTDALVNRGAMWSASDPGVLTVQTAGVYALAFGVDFLNNQAASISEAGGLIEVAGEGVSRHRGPMSAFERANFGRSTLWPCEEGDTITLNVGALAGGGAAIGSVSVEADDHFSPYLAAWWVSS
jgi:hypothetical protein